VGKKRLEVDVSVGEAREHVYVSLPWHAGHERSLRSVVTPQKKHTQTLHFGQYKFAPVILLPQSMQGLPRQSSDMTVHTFLAKSCYK
jgi:hypothetical protein